MILREIGAHAAPVPAYATLTAALTVARHGDGARRAGLAALADGDLILTAAVREPGDLAASAWAAPAHQSGAVAVPPATATVATTATRDGDAWVLDGVKTFVPYAEQAAYILVPARTEDGGVGVFALEPGKVTLSPHPSATGEPMARLGLAGVRAGAGALLGAGAHETLLGHATVGRGRRLRRRAGLGPAAHHRARQDARAVRPGARRVPGRDDAGRRRLHRQARARRRPVGGRVAARPRPDDAAEVLAVAAWAACDGALKAAYTCQHLHGGLGLDVTYPLHRHFAWIKHYAHLLGGAEARLDLIGALVA